MVYINTGKDKGTTGRVLKVLVKTQRAVVEGRNMVKKSTKPNANNPQGGFETVEAPIHVSNLNPVDSKGKPTKIKMDIVNGKKVRIAKTTGEEIK